MQPQLWMCRGGRVVAVLATVLALLTACQRQEDVPAAAPTGAAAPAAAHPPVQIQVCGQPQTYTRVPQRAVTHDTNITETFLFLGLGDRLVGYSGISSTKEIDPAYAYQLNTVPNLSAQEMGLEAMLGVQADFVFAGWSYGFKPGGVTPELLARYGIDSYVLTESCIHVQPRERVALDDALLDMRNLARIYDIEAQAAPKIAGLEQDIQRLSQRMQGVQQRPPVFVYDSDQAVPMTAGRLGMPTAIIEAAGGRNIFDDIDSNWPRGNWEDVIARDPEWIAIVDYGRPSAQGKIDFLLAKPELAQVAAIRKRQFFVMSYAQATPGPRNVAAAESLAHLLHPERFDGALARP